MKIARFQVNGEIFVGKLENGVLTSPEGHHPMPRDYSAEEVKLLSPCLPGKVVAVGLNYRDHAEELNLQLPDEPLLFLKPQSSVIGPGDKIIMPPQSARVDYEAELAIVIGKQPPKWQLIKLRTTLPDTLASTMLRQGICNPRTDNGLEPRALILFAL